MPPRPPDQERQESALSIQPAGTVEDRRGIVSFVSSTDRAGVWSLPRHLRVVAVMGAAKLDLRRARVGPDVSEVEIFAVMGSVTIIVPPEMNVECEVDPLIGSVESEGALTTTAPGAPTLRVTGSAILSSVEIEVRRVGEDGPFRKLRRALGGANARVGRVPR